MRNTKTVTIVAQNRDAGKSFLITEMSSVQGEQWAWRVILMLARAGVDMPEHLLDGAVGGFGDLMALVGEGAEKEKAGRYLEGLVKFLMRCFTMVDFEELKPLLDEMFACVRFLPNPNDPGVSRALMETGADSDDIQEINTRLLLRREVLMLHVGFSSATEPQTSVSPMQSATVAQDEPTRPPKVSLWRFTRSSKVVSPVGRS